MTDTPELGAAMRLSPNFHFDQVKPALGPKLIVPFDFSAPLGPLADFTGDWSGTGFNLIFRPQSAATPTQLPNQPVKPPSDNILELNVTKETLSFSQSLGNVPNRGSVQGDIFLNGIPYVQTVQDITAVPPGGQPTGIHFEPGIWIAIPSTTNPNEPATVTRMASIPHGVTILLQGTASAVIAGKPTIAPVDPTPFFDSSRAPFRFPSQTATDTHTNRLPQDLGPEIAAGTITQAILDDPNTVLRAHIASQNIVDFTVITVASAPTQPTPPPPALTIPAIGGGADNIAFLVGSSAPNAVVPVNQAAPAGKTIPGVTATFWIETIEHTILVPVFHPGQPPLQLRADPHPVLGTPGPAFIVHPPFPIPHPTPIVVKSKQIQYSQTVLLNFAGLTWPHVSVATLTPTTPVTVPPSVWAALHP